MNEVYLDGVLIGQTEDGKFYPLRPLSEADTKRALAIIAGKPGDLGETTIITGVNEDGASG